MKILIYGAGIIGSTYGWQLAEAGHDITMFVRKGQRQITEQGIHLICQDFRNGKKKTIDTIFHPHVIDELDAQNDFEYIVVATIIRTTILAIREGFAICLKRGYDAKAEKANKLYRLPLLISVPIAKKIYSNDALQLMFDGHINHSPEEVWQMIEDMIDNGIKYDIATPCLRKLKEML